ncbi:MAG: hypothetical protein KGJ32_06430 [Xanthomonadaceae bacterium]|nr:hypothetical protein [Xanthomonadaceae bacterium]
MVNPVRAHSAHPQGRRDGRVHPRRRRHGYRVPAAGAVEINGIRLDARDGAAIRDEPELRVTAPEDAGLVPVDSA